MPRRAASGDVPEWRALYESAAPQSGYFTVEEASDAGFSAQLLRYHVAQGKLEHANVRGVYRLAMFPPDEREDLVVAWLWSERKGVISHESALALHELSDALPSKIMLSVPASWSRRRLRVPKDVRLHYADVPE